MLIARSSRRLRARKRARCKPHCRAEVLAKLDAVMLRRLPAARPTMR